MERLLEGINALLGARLYLYRVFHALTAAEPTEDSLALLTGEFTREALQMFYLPYDEEFFQNIRGQLTDSFFLEKLKDEYTRYFIGPHELAAPPWESVYVTGHKVLLQECTLHVRRAYMRHGILPAEYPRVADDHLALELDFMARLAEKTAEAFSQNDKIKSSDLLADQKKFLKEHLLRWIFDYAQSITESGESLLYAPMALLIADWLKADSGGITEIMTILDNGEI